jgi:hypothetical protein
VEGPEVVRQLITAPKVMITIFLGVSGIHVIEYLPPGTSFDSTYFIDHILCGVNTLPIISASVRQKKAFVIHIDNPRYTYQKVSSQKSRLRRTTRTSSAILAGSCAI